MARKAGCYLSTREPQAAFHLSGFEPSHCRFWGREPTGVCVSTSQNHTARTRVLTKTKQNKTTVERQHLDQNSGRWSGLWLLGRRRPLRQGRRAVLSLLGSWHPLRVSVTATRDRTNQTLSQRLAQQHLAEASRSFPSHLQQATA